jgi:hypothetical protein
MKEEKKSIKIDPIMFQIPDTKNKTKKNKKSPGSGIKIKTRQRPKKETLKKQSLLKMIRHHQEDKYKEIFEKKKQKNIQEEEYKQDFKTSFQESKDYLANLMQEREPVSINKNKTIKDRTNLLNSAPNKPLNILNNNSNEFRIDLNNNINASTKLPELVIEPNVEMTPNINEFKIPENPKYGCLKNGSLPTYRNFFNKTKKNINNIFDSAPAPSGLEIRTREIIEKNTIKPNNYGAIHRRNKQKRIKRRSYLTGKSLKIPKITVLVSNKTIRNNTNLKLMKTKEVPITKVKRELIKRGLIKVGTITPNDVLRKMYETVELLCGDVQNYNKDNLLYNFINDK